MKDKERPTGEDRQLFLQIEIDIKRHPDKYREAGKWLDEHHNKKMYYLRRRAELRMLEREFPGLWDAELIQFFEKRITILRQLLKDIDQNKDFEVYPYKYLFDVYDSFLGKEDKRGIISPFLSSIEAKIICLVTWFVTDPDADKANLGLTQFDKIPWVESHKKFGTYRKCASLYFFSYRGNENKWTKLARLAWEKIQAEKEIPTTASGKESKKRKKTDKYKLIGTLYELHGIGTDKIKYEPVSSTEIEKKLGWSQPKVSREMKKLFGDNPMQKYKQCFSKHKLAGFMKKLEDGSYEVDGIVEPEQE